MNKNESAFAYDVKVQQDGDELTIIGNGLTKREYFAAMAMQGLCVNSCHEQEIAEIAVEIADIILLELEK